MTPIAVFKNLLALPLCLVLLLLASTSGQTGNAGNPAPPKVVIDAVSGYAGHAFVFAEVTADNTVAPAPTGTTHQSPYYAEWVRVPIGSASCPWIWAVYVFDRATNRQVNVTPPNAPSPNFGTTTLVCASPGKTPVDEAPVAEASARLDLDLTVAVTPQVAVAGAGSIISARLASALTNDLNLYLNMAIEDWSVTDWLVDFGDGQTATANGQGVGALSLAHAYGSAGQFDARVIASISGHAQAAVYDRYGAPHLIQRSFSVQVGNDALASVRPPSVIRYLPPQVQILVVPSLGAKPDPNVVGFRHIDALRGRSTVMAVHLLILAEGTISIDGRPHGFGRSTLNAWRLDASPSATPGTGTVIGQVHRAQDLLELQWNSPDRIGSNGSQDYVVPVSLYVETRFPNGHIADYLIPSSFSVSVNFAAESG